MIELLLHTSSNKTKTMGVYCQIYQCSLYVRTDNTMF